MALVNQSLSTVPQTPERSHCHSLHEEVSMCRSIKTLRRPGEAATTGELEAAARQYVRKISGYREPSARKWRAMSEGVSNPSSACESSIEVLRTSERAAAASITGRAS